MPRHMAGKIVNTACALLCGTGITYASLHGLPSIPPLGPSLSPATGVWTLTQTQSLLPHTETLKIPGLERTASVHFGPHGTAYIHAADDRDLFFAMGYTQATFRLFQMDLERRQGEGLLSQIVGKEALSSDEFEDELGLTRTATKEWLAMKADRQARAVLEAFSAGVNARIAHDEATHHLPLMFKLLHYKPTTWTPIDTLVIQGIMTQTLDYTDTPAQYAILAHSLGYARTMDFFPILPKDKQSPYDPGPYAKPTVSAVRAGASSRVNASEYQAMLSFAHQMAQVQGILHTYSDSNNWAVSGSRTASGSALMAGDPHLNQTLPSIWYQVDASAPGYHFSGVAVPGLPVILIGHNRHISWSLTDVQNQSTLLYKEETSRAHPGDYFYKGAWRPFQRIVYDIPVKGGKTVHLPVSIAAQGPVMTQHGQALAVDWMGNIPSPDLSVMLHILQAHNFAEFRSALSKWYAPTQNFVYADRKGNIGMISAGYYPLVAGGKPWLPLSGTGPDNVVGSIPYSAIPQVYDPPSGYVFSANQREVGDNYPYYIGTTYDFFANGYRADEIAHVLGASHHLTVADMERLQTTVRDYLATKIVPVLLQDEAHASLTPKEREMVQLLADWHDRMRASSPAATVWWTFWTQYVADTFGPWWSADHVPVQSDPTLAPTPALAPLDEDLQAWTLTDPTNPAFTPPLGAPRTAQQVMRLAFSQTVAALTKQLGPNPSTWKWERVHSREFPSLANINGLGYGPRGSSGDEWTVNAADGFPISEAGPSWRFVMNWATGRGYGIYPGGQSENPASPWYEDQVPTWWDGRYHPMLTQAEARAYRAGAVWTLKPAGKG
ncbi:MAG: penicillin acylase family protein [Alicyclobacillaceae bacterium]|nr:penicillin acylase family protein [Alicyclobacillaceae bacterium]